MDGPKHLEVVRAHWRLRRVLGTTLVVLLLIPVVGSIVIATNVYATEQRFRKRGISTVAEVASIASPAPARTRKLRYEIDGTVYTDEVSGNDLRGTEVGDVVAVTVDPENLANARTREYVENWFGPLALVAVSLVGLALSVRYLYRAVRAVRILRRGEWKRGYVDTRRKERVHRLGLADRHGTPLVEGRWAEMLESSGKAGTQSREEPAAYATAGRWVLILPDESRTSLLVRGTPPAGPGQTHR